MTSQTVYFTKLFHRGLEKHPEFDAVSELVRMNSRGQWWIVGGFVYRTLANELYGTAEPPPDIDVIIEKPVKTLSLPKGWRYRVNAFGNPKITRADGITIDYIPLKSILWFKERGIAPSISNLLRTMTLTIQSIVYDTARRRIIGAKGMRALRERTVRVNNIGHARFGASLLGLTVRQMIDNKARALGFTPIHD